MAIGGLNPNRLLKTGRGGRGGRGIEFGAMIEGDKALSRQLKSISDKAARKIMRSAIGYGLTPIRREARRLAPESIAKLIQKRAYVKKTAVNGQIYVRPDGGRTVTLEGREVDFSVVASILEFGSEARGIKPMAFMRRARESRQREAIERVRKRAGEVLKREWSKADKAGAVL